MHSSNKYQYQLGSGRVVQQRLQYIIGREFEQGMAMVVYTWYCQEQGYNCVITLYMWGYRLPIYKNGDHILAVVEKSV
jgi:hypothetical protein